MTVAILTKPRLQSTFFRWRRESVKSQIAFSHHLQEKSSAETIKSGARTVGSYLQQGWNKLKSGVSKANTKFREAEVFRSLNYYLDREENRRRCEQSEGEPVHPEGRSWSAYSRHVCGRGSEENWEGDQERSGSNHPEKRASRLNSDSHQREASHLSCLLEQTTQKRARNSDRTASVRTSSCAICCRICVHSPPNRFVSATHTTPHSAPSFPHSR